MTLAKYEMGITIDGVPIPDPSEWGYEVADLDTEAARAVTGLLHRNRVATKLNYEFTWKALTWAELSAVLKAVSKDKFRMVAPDPRNFNENYSGDYYVGNRTGKPKYYWMDRNEKAIFDLKMKLIEY